MICELAMLMGPAEAVAVSASRAAPDTTEIVLILIAHLPLGFPTPPVLVNEKPDSRKR
jgi:hypothetical protein